MAQIKHLIYPERYAGDVELAIAIRELQDIQIARSDAAPDQIGPQAAPTPDPERILPSGKELWEKKLGSLSFSFPELSAKKQQITVEAICQWVERYRGMLTWAAFCRQLRADAARVVRESKGEE